MGSAGVALLAGALLVFLPVCGAFDAHATQTLPDEVESCCVIVEGKPTQVPSAAPSERGGFGLEARGWEIRPYRGPQGPRALMARREPRTLSFYARSARILR